MHRIAIIIALLLVTSRIFTQENANLSNQEYVRKKLHSAVVISSSDLIKANKLVQEAIDTASKVNDRALLIEAYYTQAILIYNSKNYEEAIIPANQALVNAIDIGREIQALPVYELLSIIYIAKDLKLESLEYLYKGYNLSVQLNDSSRLTWFLLAIAEIEQELGNVTNAMEYSLKSIDYFSSSKDSLNLAKSFFNLGLVHKDLGNFSNSEQNIQKALTLFNHFGDSVMIGKSINGLSRLLLANGKLFESREFALKSKKILNGIDKKEYYRNEQLLAEIEFALNKHKSALQIITTTINHQEKGTDNAGIAYSYLLLGNFLVYESELSKANEAYKRCIFKSKEVGLYKLIRQAYNGLSNIASKTGKSQEAYQYLNRYIEITDSLYNLQKVSQAIRLENEVEIQKKQKELLLKEAELHLNNQTIKVEQQRKILLYVVIVLFIGATIFFSRDYKKKKKLNIELAEQKQIFEDQKQVAEKRNRDIHDSLNYARRIQRAILRASLKFEEVFPQSFIVYIPKDIVSGDFYWVKKVDKQILFAIADCTGHGAPGAFMSIIGTHGLNKYVDELKLTYPGEILNSINEFFKTSFEQQEGSEIFDGMDICVCAFNPVTKELNYSGANIPLNILRGNVHPAATAHITFKDDRNTLYQVVPDKQSIGYSFDEVDFKTHSIQLIEGDLLYLFTDGFSDQIGGHDGKKFRVQELRKLLCNMAGTSFDDQKQNLEKIYKEWKGNYIQVDDVSIIGIKISS